jgi:diaminopimelate epimerase
LAASVVGRHEAVLTSTIEGTSVIPSGRTFYKMSGSGNDFVMVDARTDPPGQLGEPEVVQRICARGTGVGADGIVFLEPSAVADVRLVYLNADGTRAELCGNATLCTTRLSVELGLADPRGFAIETDSGIVAARLSAGQPEIDLQPVREVQRSVAAVEPVRGEQRIGFAVVGVPHLVIEVDDIASVDVVGRGRPLRNHPSLSRGANVNFVAAKARANAGDQAGGAEPGRWRIRTYERGVEAETLACGSGSVATAILLTVWDRATGPVELETSSGRILTVRLRRDGEAWLPSLSGEGRVVYKAALSEI